LVWPGLLLRPVVKLWVFGFFVVPVTRYDDAHDTYGLLGDELREVLCGCSSLIHVRVHGVVITKPRTVAYTYRRQYHRDMAHDSFMYTCICYYLIFVLFL
jgi:hypothetical protein